MVVRDSQEYGSSSYIQTACPLGSILVDEDRQKLALGVVKTYSSIINTKSTETFTDLYFI